MKEYKIISGLKIHKETGDVFSKKGEHLGKRDPNKPHKDFKDLMGSIKADTESQKKAVEKYKVRERYGR